MATKALLVGIDDDPDAPLKGCVNDVERLREVLTQRSRVESQNIRVLTDAEATTNAMPGGLEWLAAQDGLPEEAGRLSHFSGHGTFIADRSGWSVVSWWTGIARATAAIDFAPQSESGTGIFGLSGLLQALRSWSPGV